MSAVGFFNAARAFKRELSGNALDSLTQADVDALNAVVSTWKVVQAVAKGLTVPAAFYGAVRAAFGALKQEQVSGFDALLTAMGKARWPRSWVAYGLATAWHETAKTMQPVEEAFWKNDAWRKANLRYYPWHGRGYVQLTWERNYARADEECGLGGKLIANRDLAMDPAIAAAIMVRGMEGGWFTGKGLKDYVPRSGTASHDAYKAARRIINGQDKAAEIAKIALAFDAALEAGKWA